LANNELIYRIALTQMTGIGDVIAKNLLAYCGSAGAVFKAKKTELLKIPHVGEIVAGIVLRNQNNPEIFKRVEKEIEFIEKKKVKPLFFTDIDYPNKLKHCNDAPIMLFYKGTADLNQQKIVGVVGTRTPTDYGRSQTEKLIAGLKELNVLIVSGLAYGIDTYAHKASIVNGMETIGVLAHGLDELYPATNSTLAHKMLKQGGLLTEFLTDTNPDKENFPKRNRIVAGMCDAIVVIESKKTGGALITADIAAGYSRDVFAFPGKSGDECSEGCNKIIKQNKAALIENAEDLIYAMCWEQTQKVKAKKQVELPVNLSNEENQIVNLLKDIQAMHVDEICSKLQLTPGKASGLLLQLEFSNIVKSLPGKLYTIN
jgi:DNA processing protein